MGAGGRASAGGERDERFRKRLPCRVRLGESSYSGVVLNLSRTGLFVQTSAVASPGDVVDLTLSGEIPLKAKVMWRRRVPGRLRSVAEGGVGLRIVAASEAYYRLLAEASGTGEAKTPPVEVADRAPKPLALLFRAHVQQDVGPRSRTIDVSAVSEEEAARRVRAQLECGWSIVRIERRA